MVFLLFSRSLYQCVVQDHRSHIPLHRRSWFSRNEVENITALIGFEVLSCTEEQTVDLFQWEVLFTALSVYSSLVAQTGTIQSTDSLSRSSGQGLAVLRREPQSYSRSQCIVRIL